MPVAVPLRPEPSVLDREQASSSSSSAAASEEENSELESEYLSEGEEVEDDDDDEMDYEIEDYEDEFEEFSGVSVAINEIFFPGTPRSASREASHDPYYEYFQYQEARGLGNGQCQHAVLSSQRPCRHCPAKFSPVFYTSCQLMHQSIFGDRPAFKRSNPNYVPKHRLAIERFRAITAMHDSGYVRCLFEEIVHYIGYLQNQRFRDGKSEHFLKTKLFWLYEFVERLFLSLQDQSSGEEFTLIGAFRGQLRTVGLCSRFDENVQHNRRVLPLDCQR